VIYNRIAWFYDVCRPLLTIRRAELDLNSLFAGRIYPDSRVLELAPGTGVNVKRLFDCAGGFKSYLGIDTSSEMLSRARDKAGNNTRIQFKLADATDTSGIDGTFDFIVSTWFLSHLPCPEVTVGSILELLRPGGTAVFLFFSRPGNGLALRLLSWNMRLIQCVPVEAESICALPYVEAVHCYRGNTSTLVVFHRPVELGSGHASVTQM
jgi:ubiquinone/menaquinone biosynthesis C-methylase UbiE